jgi:membrane protein implicated in regulation of membrane protease activity
MLGDWVTLIWLFAGLLLIASELVHTSFTALFLGAGAIIVAALHGVGLVEGLVPCLLLWAGASLGLAIPLRPMARRYLPGERKYDPSDEDRNAYGTVVEVAETVFEDNQAGRIRFQGTTWPAMSLDGTILAGAKARIVSRDKLAWIVESLSDDDSALEGPKH